MSRESDGGYERQKRQAWEAAAASSGTNRLMSREGEAVSERPAETPQQALRRYVGERGRYSQIRLAAAADEAAITKETNWRALVTASRLSPTPATEQPNTTALTDANHRLALAQSVARVRETDPATGAYYAAARAAFRPVMARYMSEALAASGNTSVRGEFHTRMEAADQVTQDIASLRSPRAPLALRRGGSNTLRRRA